MQNPCLQIPRKSRFVADQTVSFFRPFLGSGDLVQQFPQ